MHEELPEITEPELNQRVLYSLLGAVAKFAKRCSVPLKEVISWMEVAYYQELNRAGLSQKETADFFGVSVRKVSQLASRLKKNFLRPELAVGLARQIEYMLWAGPLSEGRLIQSLEDYSEADVRAALDTLVAQERVIRSDGRTVHYEVPDSEFRLYRQDWLSRIDGLNNHLTNVVDGICARFFDYTPHAFTRTLDLRVREDQVEELRRLYDEMIFPRLRELDSEAKEADEDQETIEIGLSTNWAPQLDRE